MDTITLQAKTRTEHGKNLIKLRKLGLIPAVTYGHGQENVSVSVEARTIEKIYSQVGGSKLISLQIGEGALQNVLIHDVQVDPRTGALKHLDFYIVRMDEELETEVPLHFVGESTAVYQDEGVLLKVIEVVNIRTLPGNLPESIEVDISVLDDFEKTITVGDLHVAKGVTILADTEDIVAKVDPPRSDAEMAELEETVSEELPEGVQEEQVAVKESGGGRGDR